MYPYIAGSTGLTAVLPPSASAGGKLFDRLADPVELARIRSEVLDQKTDWENMGILASPEGILVLELKKPENAKYAGKRLSAIAQAEGKHWLDAAMDLILSERQSLGTVYFMMNEDNVKLQLRQPWIKFGTDAEGADPENAKTLTHPRSYGTFPRILGKYVREERVIPLEDAIRKMTSAVARGSRSAIVACAPRLPRGCRRLRSRDDRRPGHVREASSGLDRRPPSYCQRRGRGPREPAHRSETGPDRSRPRL